jgi:hypothetical protein
MSDSAALGSLIDEMHDIRERRRELAKEEKILGQEYEALQASLIASLEATGMTSGASDIASAAIKVTEVANVQDWEVFHKWLRKTNRLYMLERRPAQAAFREFLEASRGHKPPPGVVTFEKTTISLRNR